MEEEKKSTNNDVNKLDWRLVARAYSILIALVTDRLVKKEHLKLLNDIVAEAQTVDMALIEYPCPQNMYRCMMRQINRIITDRLVDYTLDNATKAETDEMFGLCEIRNALDGVSMKAFEYMLTTVITGSADVTFDKLREYRIALKAVAPDSANAIIADIEMRYGTYAGPQYGAPMSQPPMQQPWPWTYQPGSPYATMQPGGLWQRTAGQPVNPFAQRVYTPGMGMTMGSDQLALNPYSSAMTDTLGGDDGKKN